MRKISLLLLSFGLTIFLMACDPTGQTKPGGDDPVYYVVTFDSKGGSSVDKQTIEEKKTADEPDDPSRTGFIFGGWYTDSATSDNKKYDFATPVEKNITLYAKWTEDDGGVPASEKLALDIAALEEYDKHPITKSNLNLPTKGDNGSTFSWSSSDSSTITNSGVVLPSPIGGEEKEVTLTLNAKNGSATEKVQYHLVIPAKKESVVTDSKKLPFECQTVEYEIEDGELMTYFVDNGTVPYVNLEDFMNVIQGFAYSDELEYTYDITTSKLALSYTVTYVNDENDPTDDEDVTYQAVIDFKNNTVLVDNDSFFNGYIYSTGTDFSSGLTYLEDVYLEEGDAILYDINAYRFDLIYDEGKYLMPFHITNLLFCGGSYFNVYYNGDGYKGIYAYGDDPLDFRTSSLNATMPSADMMLATMDTFAFTLDYFYGLKEEKEIDTFYDELYKVSNNLLSTSKSTNTKGYSDFVLKVLDELHSSFVYSTVYGQAVGNTPSVSIVDIGPHYLEWNNVYTEVRSRLVARWPNGKVPNYRIIPNSNTAIIYLDEFVTKQVGDGDDVVDSNDYMRKAIADIFNENANIQNIAIDISSNLGGNIGALYRVLGYITDNPIASHYQNPLTGEKQTYWLEVDTEAIDVNWFFITSKVTFSAANLMAAIGKYQDVATIIGTTSGGGACSILPIYLPDGSCFQISSLNLISYRTGNETDGYKYHSVEQGITPDYYLAVYSLFDDDAIGNLIKEINDGTATLYSA